MINSTYKLGCMNSIAVGVHTPRMRRSNNFVNPAPLPAQMPQSYIYIYIYIYINVYFIFSREHSHYVQRMLYLVLIHIIFIRPTFECANQYHNKICIWIKLPRVSYSVVYLFTSVKNNI